MAMVNLTIDGVKVSVEAGTTILKAAHAAGIKIPTLCWLKDINEIGACRMCVVDVGARALAAACVMPVSEGMVVKTNTPQVRQARKSVLELILSNHERKCLSCVRSQNCELQALAKELGVDESKFDGQNIEYPLDTFSPSIVRDPNKCILCRRCVSVCRNVQKIGAIGAVNRGFKTIIAPAFEKNILETNCVFCGQCITSCPVGALREKDDTDKVWEAISDPEKFVVVQPAPAVRVALGEEFGMPIGTRVTGKMSQALKRLGFDKVFDTDFGADLTIMEEAAELLSRVKNGGVLPMFTSCSPGWVKYLEHNFPEMIPNLSTCKSPMQMEGAIIKTYYAEKAGIDPSKIVVVAVMPCTSKKFEASRSEMEVNGLRAVDISITTRELARMIRQARIEFTKLPDEECFDELVAQSTGAAPIFGATGGVMEAALRTAADVLEGKSLENVEYKAVRGLEGIKEATVTLGGVEIKAAVAHSTGAAKELIQRIKSGEANYAFVEVMACPGGCVNGGGQPIVEAFKRLDVDHRAARAAGLYAEDEAKAIRKSHENPDIQKLYKEFLGEPNSHKAHELLHTHYTDRSKK
ncbi:MAG: iron hydrogenase small subunit [Clostridia bacterium]|nr:iron hydrogenase small subunit [Clostridia bacterium]